ncbi:MAG: pilus assembly protein [Candidatus Dormibacteraeota bacterium]|nr:pilus assembly protein [Candidatus Dormibacteraeota bacterium]
MVEARGQATVEFAMVIAVFLLLLFGGLSASLYTVERGAAVTAVASGARVAAGSAPGNPNAPNVDGATAEVTRLVRPALFGTRVNRLTGGAGCRQPAQVPAGQVDVCASLNPAGMVDVELKGRPANPVPPAFGFDWLLDVGAEIEPVTFKP